MTFQWNCNEYWIKWLFWRWDLAWRSWNQYITVKIASLLTKLKIKGHRVQNFSCFFSPSDLASCSPGICCWCQAGDAAYLNTAASPSNFWARSPPGQPSVHLTSINSHKDAIHHNFLRQELAILLFSMEQRSILIHITCSLDIYNGNLASIMQSHIWCTLVYTFCGKS